MRAFIFDNRGNVIAGVILLAAVSIFGIGALSDQAFSAAVYGIEALPDARGHQAARAAEETKLAAMTPQKRQEAQAKGLDHSMTGRLVYAASLAGKALGDGLEFIFGKPGYVGPNISYPTGGLATNPEGTGLDDGRTEEEKEAARKSGANIYAGLPPKYRTPSGKQGDVIQQSVDPRQNDLMKDDNGSSADNDGGGRAKRWIRLETGPCAGLLIDADKPTPAPCRVSR